MNDILKKIDGVLEEGQLKLAELSKKQGDADAVKAEYQKKISELIAKEHQLEARAVVIEKYEDIDKAISNNNAFSKTLSELDAKLKADAKKLKLDQEALEKAQAEVATMKALLKTKDQNLDKAKADLEVAKSEMQDKVLEEIKKKLLK